MGWFGSLETHHYFSDSLWKLLIAFKLLFLLLEDLLDNGPADGNVSDEGVDVDGVVNKSFVLVLVANHVLKTGYIGTQLANGLCRQQFLFGDRPQIRYVVSLYQKLLVKELVILIL